MSERKDVIVTGPEGVVYPPSLATKSLRLTLVRVVGDWALYAHGGARYYAVGPRGQVYETLDNGREPTLRLIARERARPTGTRTARGHRLTLAERP